MGFLLLAGPNVNVKVTTVSTKVVASTPTRNGDYVSSEEEEEEEFKSSLPTSTIHPYNFIASSSPSSSLKIPRLPPISSIISPKPAAPAPLSPNFYSTTPIVLKVGKLSQNLEQTTLSPPKSADDRINTGETRVAITADQVSSGNRPTSRPFHFTTPPPTPPPPSTTVREPSRINHYHRQHSPHNHIFAPTRDPVSDVDSDDDLSVEGRRN